MASFWCLYCYVWTYFALFSSFLLLTLHFVYWRLSFSVRLLGFYSWGLYYCLRSSLTYWHNCWAWYYSRAYLSSRHLYEGNRRDGVCVVWFITSSHPDALKNLAIFTGKQLCWSLCNMTHVTPTQMFSCEYCEISKNIFLKEHLWMTAPDSF